MSGQDSSGSHCEVGETKLTAVEGHLVSLQVEENGRFEGQWIWNSLVTSVWVFVQYIVDAPIEEKKREGIIRYYRGRQRTDGSWGWHEESGGYLTTTTMAYVSLRLLGVSPDDPGMQKALDWIHAQPDGVQSIPMLGKFWLACINLFDWSGVKIVPAELWLLPSWCPIHPSRFYTFFRLAIMSLMYVSGVRFQKPASPVIVELQAELYRGEFEKIDWPACRFLVAGSDLYGSSPSFLRKALDLLHFYDRNPPAKPRRRALAKCLEQIVYEERTSRNHSNTPLTGLMNCVALYAHDPGHEELEPSVSGKEAWKVEDEEGIRYVASRSGVWDTAFAMQALLESPNREANKDTLARAYNFLVSFLINSITP